jgi:hypothetical protein
MTQVWASVANAELTPPLLVNSVQTICSLCAKLIRTHEYRQEALEQLQQPTELYILNISQPILNPEASAKRSSNASDQERTPSALQADLEHYRELFSKLRFSYVEQVTKERFLRAVTAEQPEFVDGDENRELGEKLAADKAALKARKEEVRGIIGDLEEQGRVLAKRKCRDITRM